MQHSHFPTLLVLILLLVSIASAEVYVRVNQIGFSPDERKTAVIMSDQFLIDSTAKIENLTTGDTKTIPIAADQGAYLAFPHHYRIDLTSITTPGQYRIHIEGSVSFIFSIGYRLYSPICDSVLLFLREQRCGDNNPLYHKPCHLLDATSIAGERGRKLSGKIDLTGGWHDAADYVKFTLTTAYATYLLLLTQEVSPGVISDHDGNSVSDLLDEAKIGLDWLMKVHYKTGRVLTQVSDLSDHTVGWRMPESDPLSDRRPAHYAPSQAYSGSVAAALALASARFLAIGDKDYSTRCLAHAAAIYRSIPSLPDWASGPDSMYIDRTCIDNRALAAIELYRATGEENYLDEAIVLSKQLPETHWISWGDVGGYVHARLIPFDPAARAKLAETLDYYAEFAKKNPFGYPLANFPWGSAALQSGVAILSQLYESATVDSTYRWLAEMQRDFLLGCNSHGVSMITGIGSEYPRNPHHQIAFLTKIPLPGALVAGYCSMEQIKRQRIPYEGLDRFVRFQSNEAGYFDDRNDYLCNEPTIGNNAQALFMMAWFASQERKP